MIYKKYLKYIFASVLALFCGYGYITGIDNWQVWVVASLAYLFFSLVSEIYMD